MPKAQVNGTVLHYHLHGSGIPILFIHPPFLTSSNFKYQEVQLSEQFQVITFDIRGHGNSEPSSQPITYPLIVEDMKQLMDFLEIDKAFVCGYSAGGSIAMEALLTYPDRFLGGIIVSGMSEVSDIVLKGEITLAALMAKLFPRLLAKAIAWGNADMRQTFDNLYREALYGNKENIMQYYAYSRGYNCTSKLSRIKIPLLLIYGEKNSRFRRYARIIANEVPNCEFHVFKGMTHQIPTKAALQMNELIQEWARRHDSENERKPDEDIKLAHFVEETSPNEQQKPTI